MTEIDMLLDELTELQERALGWGDRWIGANEAQGRGREFSLRAVLPLSFDRAEIAARKKPEAPPLSLGERCRLNSGGPDMTVIAADGESVTVAWLVGAGDKIDGASFPRACVRKVA